MAKRDRKKRKRGPTPKRREPRRFWAAECEGCGELQPLHIEPSTDREHLMSPCGHCGCQTATYSERVELRAA